MDWLCGAHYLPRGILSHSVLSVTAGYLAATSESKRRAVQGLRLSER
jgi:hypothetical protein